MKRIKRDPIPKLLFVSILIFSVTAFIGCKDQTNGDKEPSTELEVPDQIISIEQARVLYDNYSKHRVPLIQQYEDSGRIGDQEGKMQQNMMRKQSQEIEKDTFDVARYGYYDYQTIKDYLAYIEQEAKKAGEDISTLRIYFSNYPDEDKFVHPRQNSFLIMPTIKRGDRDYAFFIAEEQSESRAVLLGDQLQEEVQKGLGTLQKQSNKAYASIMPSTNNIKTSSNYFQNKKSLIMNEGNMVPPPYHNN